MWTVSFTANRDDATAFVLALDDIAVAVSQFEDGQSDGQTWRIDALFDEEPDTAELTARLAIAGTQVEKPSPSFTITRVLNQDWVASTLSTYSPLRVGRFWVHGGHHRGLVPAGSLPLRVDAATAFGTGEHESTSGCLSAIDQLGKRSPFTRLVRSQTSPAVLDLGCGTGILAMAAARLWRKSVLATDIDTETVRVANRMVHTNGLRHVVELIQANGVADRRIHSAAPFALISANILARPLRRLSADVFSADTASGRRPRLNLFLLFNPSISMTYLPYPRPRRCLLHPRRPCSTVFT